MQPAATTLRPMDLGTLLDTVFRIYRNNFLVFVGIAALMQLPMIILQLWLGIALGRRFTADLLTVARELPFFDLRSDPLSDLPLASIAAFLGLSLLLALVQTVIVQQLINGALANAIAHRYLGQPISVLGAYRLGGKIGALIVVGLLLTLLGGVAAVLLFALYIGGLAVVIQSVTGIRGGGAVAAALFGFLMLLGLLLGLLLLFALVALRFLFATQAVVLEGRGPLAAMARSWQLIRGSFWRVLGIFLLLYLLILLLVNVPVAIVTVALDALLGSSVDPLRNYALRQAVLTLTSYLAQIVILPIQLGAYTLLYYDLRVRKEGYDLELRASQHPT